MPKNTIADLDVTTGNNTDVLGQNSQGSADANQLDAVDRATLALLARFYADLGGVVTVGGSANAITVTSASTYQTLESGLVIAFKAGSANTAAATLNLDGLGAKAVRLPGDVALAGGEIKANGRYLVMYDAAYNTAAGAWVLMNPEGSGIGQQTIWVPASGMIPATTNGAAFGSSETTTNKVMVTTLDFDTTTEEFAQFMIQMPKSWNEGTLVAQFVWTHAATTTNFGVCWGFEAVAISDDDASDAAWGTEVATTDTGGTTGDVYISAESSAVTVGGTPAAEDLVAFRVTRVVGNGGDTMAIDAKLIGVKIHYTTDAGTDD